MYSLTMHVEFYDACLCSAIHCQLFLIVTVMYLILPLLKIAEDSTFFTSFSCVSFYLLLNLSTASFFRFSLRSKVRLAQGVEGIIS
jgi:hypothetical protein